MALIENNARIGALLACELLKCDNAAKDTGSTFTPLNCSLCFIYNILIFGHITCFYFNQIF